MLLQLEHQHNNKQQPPSPKLDHSSNSRISKQLQDPSLQPHSIFFTPQHPIHDTSTYNFFSQGLNDIRKTSQVGLPEFITKKIEERRRFSDMRVYEAIGQRSVAFVGLHLREYGQGMKVQLQAMLEGVHNAVEAGIWDGRYEIDDSRNKKFSLAKKQQVLIGSITAELVKRNIEQFKQELEGEGEDPERQTIDLNLSQHAKSESYRTKQAENFVKKMQEEQFRHKSNIAGLEQERRAREIREIEARIAAEQTKKRQRQQTIRRRVELNQQKMRLQRERRAQVHGQYLHLVSSQPKPLYIKRQQKYRHSVAEQQRRKYHLMSQLKESKKPINLEQLQQHMSRYQQLLQENQSFRQQKRQLKQSEYQIIASKRPYRSKFYSLSVQGQTRIDPMQAKTAMVRRQQEYADHVKRNYIPRCDSKKQLQLQDLIKNINSHKKQDPHSRKYMEQGKRNLEKLHLLIGELRAKNKLKESIVIQDSPLPIVKKYKNYLEELKEVKQKLGDKGKGFEDVIGGKSEEEIRMMGQLKEERARLKERFLSSSINSIDIHTHMEGNSTVEKNYIESAQAKMALLKKYRLDDSAEPS